MNKKLYCSPEKKLCGVCSGVADYFNIDPTIIRLGVVLLAMVTAILPALIIYFIIALIMPKAPDNYYQLYNNTSRRLTRGRDKRIAGVCSGFAERLDADPTIIRVLFVLFALLFGYSLLFYIACIFIMPKPFDAYQQYSAPGGDPNAWQYGQNQSYQNPNYQNPNYQNPENPGQSQNGDGNNQM